MEAATAKKFDFADVLTRMTNERASDVHLSPGYPPAVRVRGRITPLEEYGNLSIQDTRDTVYSLLNDDQRKRFESRKQLDLAYAVPGVARFRVNCFFQRGSISAAFRRIPHQIPALAELNLPAVLRELTKKPRGFVLVTGPTGSGKTTTLYSALNELNNPDFNIVTVEDPVEFQLIGVNQVPVRKEIGLSFANALRSILRQDPDIVMIGEIRDAETAEIAVEAALTGHQVLSTMHCNDAPGAISRMDDMGIAPFLISSSVILSCAQRLVRRICSVCKEPVSYPPKMFEDLHIEPKFFEGAQLFRGHGCERCKNSGYAGRAAIIEAMTVSDSIRKLVIQRLSANEIGKVAVTEGMQTLRMVALEKAREGITTLEQVLVTTPSPH